MAMSMKEKSANTHVKTEWPAALKPEFAREAEQAERLRRLRASVRDRQDCACGRSGSSPASASASIATC